MTTISKLLEVLPSLGLLACVSDFSPDPYKGSQNVDTTAWPDGGAKGAAKADAKAPMRDASATVDPRGDDEPSADKAEPTGEPKHDGGMEPPGGPCDLSGRWIMVERTTSVALGAQQVSRGWHYLELEQQGDRVTMKKTLFCGGLTDSPPNPILTVHLNDEATWPQYVKNPSYNGRRGTSQRNGSRCDVAFEERAHVRAATVAAYQDRSVKLPTKDQRATGTTPGWEDWDDDGNPGYTQDVGDLGKLYTCVRTFTAYEGTIEQAAAKFQLEVDWDQQRVVLGTATPDPTGILSSPAARDNSGDNFAQFARLSATQATGSDEAICEAIRRLADTLTPEANAEP